MVALNVRPRHARSLEVYNQGMKVATGKVVGGKIVLEGETLHEGAVVTVVVHDDAEAWWTKTGRLHPTPSSRI